MKHHLIRRLDRITIELAEIRREIIKDRPDPVIPALVASFGEMVFTSAEAWQRAAALRAEAESLGLDLPELPAALERVGIRNCHALARFLGKRPEVAQIGKDRDGVIWMINEIAKPHSAFPKGGD